MSEMYKIVRYVPQDMVPFGDGFIGAERYHGFEKAKRALYNTIDTKYDGMREKLSALIDSYCAKYYPQGAPENFNMLKNFLKEYLSNPETFDFKEKYADIDFEDDHIRFALSFEFAPEGVINVFYIEIVDEDVKYKFPEGVITTLELGELTSTESERYISLTAGKNIGLDIVFSLMTDEDEEDMFFEN